MSNAEMPSGRQNGPSEPGEVDLASAEAELRRLGSSGINFGQRLHNFPTVSPLYVQEGRTLLATADRDFQISQGEIDMPVDLQYQPEIFTEKAFGIKSEKELEDPLLVEKIRKQMKEARDSFEEIAGGSLSGGDRYDNTIRFIEQVASGYFGAADVYRRAVGR
jgi:hypothetical protein